MDFTLSKKHEMARQLFKDFAETEVKPLAQEVDETEHFPMDTVKKMGKYGFMGIPVPKEYGGQGCDILTYVMCVEELSKYVLQQVLLYQHIHHFALTQYLHMEQKSRRRNIFQTLQVVRR